MLLSLLKRFLPVQLEWRTLDPIIKFAPKLKTNTEAGQHHRIRLATTTGTNLIPHQSTEKMAPNSPVKRQHIDSVIITNDVSPSKPVLLKFCKCKEGAQAPKRGSDKAAGYDLFSASDCIVPAKGKFVVETGLKIALPENSYGRIAPRSGLAARNFIDVGAGVIDQDYRGEVGVLLFNFSDVDFTVTKGMRIAQLICERIYMPELEECQELDATSRGSGGYGSSGLH